MQIFKINVVTLQRKTQNGALDEWLSHRSAKPSTAVRIRQAPLKELYNVGFFFLFLDEKTLSNGERISWYDLASYLKSYQVIFCRYLTFSKQTGHKRRIAL